MNNFLQSLKIMYSLNDIKLKHLLKKEDLFILSTYIRMETVYEDNTSKNLKEVMNMSRVITDSCVSCGTCESECPVSAISAGDEHYVIDADACIDCGACQGVCPTGAIEEE